MTRMFERCHSLKKLDLSKFETNNLIKIDYMFSGCSSLKEIKFDKGFNIIVAESMNNMFNGCWSLKKLNLYYFSNVKKCNICNMFNGCGVLEEINLKTFNFDKIENKFDIFNGCTSLKRLIISKSNEKDFNLIKDKLKLPASISIQK